MTEAAPAGGAWENPVRARLRDGKPVFGITLTTPSLDVAARAAALGFDFLWVEMEHAPITLESLRGIVLATRGLPAVPFARVPVNEVWAAKRVLDAGVCGVLFPFTSTPDLARRAAAACRYPPAGCRGSGAGLAKGTWPDPAGYYDSADCNVFVVAIVEEARALDHLDEIAGTPGVDALFVGTSDLSFSLGYRGRQDEPRLEAAVEEVREAAARYGKPAGRPARTADEAREYLERGFRLFQTVTELGFFEAGARAFLEPLGAARGAASRPVY